MQFEWDETKRQSNLLKHGLDFRDAFRVFDFFVLTALDVRQDYGEDRWVSVGMLEGRYVVLIHADAPNETPRLISFRKATTHERARYEQALRDRLEQG